jgi:hypothetical protein
MARKLKTEPAEKTPVERPRRTDLREAVDKAIDAIVAKLSTNEVKGTVGDLIRLLQLREELGPATPRGVTAKWVEPCETTVTGE